MLQRMRVKFVETSEKEKPVQNALTLSAEAVMIKVSKLISSKGFRFRNQISQTKYNELRMKEGWLWKNW